MWHVGCLDLVEPAGRRRFVIGMRTVRGGVMWKDLAVAASLGLALAASQNVSAKSQENVATGAQTEEGRRLFMTYCASCHGTAARGDGPVADTLSTRPADLTELAKGGPFVADRIQRIIDGRDRYIKAHGSLEMPVWGDAFRRREGLSEEGVKARIEAIVRYLRSIQRRLG